MRDPGRIIPFAELLGELWKENVPDARFGQLITNYIAWHEQEYDQDIFYLEEPDLLIKFKEFLINPKRQQENKGTTCDHSRDDATEITKLDMQDIPENNKFMTASELLDVIDDAIKEAES